MNNYLATKFRLKRMQRNEKQITKNKWCNRLIYTMIIIWSICVLILMIVLILHFNQTQNFKFELTKGFKL